jgi:hypothetical protein
MVLNKNNRCRQCGAILDEKAQFCEDCGSAVENDGGFSQPLPYIPTSQVYPVQPPVASRSNWPQIALIGGGIMLCCSVLVCLGGLFLTRSSGSSASPQATALNQSTLVPTPGMPTEIKNQETATSMPPTSTPQPTGMSMVTPMAPPAPQSNIPACQGVDNPPQLKIGDRAVVVNVGGYTLSVYDAPSYKATFLAAVPEGATVIIISGPVCAEYSYWWQVEYGEGGQSGWMIEVEMNDVFLKPGQ